MHKQLNGTWTNEDGTIHTLAVLIVEVSATGGLTDAETGQPLIAERWGATDIVTNGMWRFSPNAGELDRVGAHVALRGSTPR